MIIYHDSKYIDDLTPCGYKQRKRTKGVFSFLFISPKYLPILS